MENIIENLKVISEHLNKDWDGKFSECGCGAYLIGHPEKCRGCGGSDLTYLEVCLNGTFDSKRAQNSGTIELKHWSSHDYDY